MVNEGQRMREEGLWGWRISYEGWWLGDEGWRIRDEDEGLGVRYEGWGMRGEGWGGRGEEEIVWWGREGCGRWQQNVINTVFYCRYCTEIFNFFEFSASQENNTFLRTLRKISQKAKLIISQNYENKDFRTHPDDCRNQEICASILKHNFQEGKLQCRYSLTTCRVHLKAPFCPYLPQQGLIVRWVLLQVKKCECPQW